MPKALDVKITWKNGTTTVVRITWANPKAYAGYQTLAHYGRVIRTACPGAFNYTHVTMICGNGGGPYPFIFSLSIVCRADAIPTNPATTGTGFFMGAYGPDLEPAQRCDSPSIPGPFHMVITNLAHQAHFDTNCLDGSTSCNQMMAIEVNEPAAAELAGELEDRRAPCVHRGEETGDLRDCETCTGRVRLKVLGCDVYGACTVDRQADGLACCATCPDYQGPANVD